MTLGDGKGLDMKDVFKQIAETEFNKKYPHVSKKRLNTNSYHNYAIKNLAKNFENIAETLRARDFD